MYSCIHDEVNSASEPSNKEYTSKSLWKEDEKYIQNVKTVFEKYANKNYFTTNFGTIYWDYALTMGTFDESFLEAPVIKNGKVNFILVAYREGDRVFFKRKADESSKEFFDILVFKERNQLKGRVVDDRASSRGLLCYTVETIWTWTNADGSAGETFTYHETTCKGAGPYLPCQSVEVNDNCGGSTAGGPPGGSGSGGGGIPVGYPYPENPCEKSKSIMSKPDVQAKITELKNQSKIGGELGVKMKADGTTSPIISGGAHEVELGDTAGYQGGYHNHTPTGIKMLSPPDIVKMLDFAMAQNGGNIQHGFMGMIGSEKCSTCQGGYRYYNYMINFNGTVQELAGFLYNSNWDLESLKDDYQEREGKLAGNLSYVDYLGADLNNKGLEKLFFDTLKKMGMEGKINLQKIEDNGTIQNITLNSDGNSTTATPCP